MRLKYYMAEMIAKSNSIFKQVIVRFHVCPGNRAGF